MYFLTYLTKQTANMNEEQQVEEYLRSMCEKLWRCAGKAGISIVLHHQLMSCFI